MTAPAGAKAPSKPTRPKRLKGSRLAPDGRQFPWGPIDAVHRVGPYAIVEYRLDASNHVETQPWVWEQHGETRFHVFIDDRSTGHGYNTLDSALVGAVAYRREGPNSRAATYFDRMTLVSDDD